MEDYLAAKLRLWELLPAGAPAVVNVDNEWSLAPPARRAAWACASSPSARAGRC